MKVNFRGIVTTLLLVLIATTLAIVAGEFVLRALQPFPGKYLTWPPHLRKVFSPNAKYVHGVRSPVRYVINAEGIRGDEFSQDQKYRVLSIGGSTTECLYQDQHLTWSGLVEDRLQRDYRELKPWVGNLGKSGFNSRHHVMQMKYEVPQLPHLDTIIVLVGCNDLTLRLIRGNAYDPDHLTTRYGEQHQIRRTFVYYPLGFGFLYDLKDTAWWRLIQATTKPRVSILAMDDYGKAVVNLRERRAHAVKLLDRLPDMGPALTEYARNVNTIIDLGKKLPVRMIFVTQPSLWRPDLTSSEKALLWGGGAEDVESSDKGVYYDVAALAKGMALYNSKLLEVCAARGIECVDLAAVIPKDMENFFDDVHFTDRGSQNVAHILAAYLEREPGLRTGDRREKHEVQQSGSH